MKKNIVGYLEDGTRYKIEENNLIINNKVWFSGTKEEMNKYIEYLNSKQVNLWILNKGWTT